MTRSSRTPLVGLLATLSMMVVALFPANPALAAPSPQQQMDTLWNQLEPLIEQYNGVHAKLLADQAKAAALKTQMDPLLSQVDLAATRVGALASELYMLGPLNGINALLTSGTPTELADQVASLDAIAAAQKSTIDGAKTLVDSYNTQKKPLDDLIAAEAAEDADLAAKKTQIQAQLAQLQKLVSTSAVSIAVLKPTSCPVPPPGGFTPADQGPGLEAAKVACNEIGKPYVWATAGPSTFDCSGLTMYSWAQEGVSLAHYTKDQWTHTPHVGSPNYGDLVFYFSDVHHVGIYVGGGWVVHAPHPGDHVRMAVMTSVGTVHGYARP